MLLELQNHKHFICGIQGSGKTYLAKYFARGFKKPAVYRVNKDFDKENVLLYKPENIYKELNQFIKWFKLSKCDLLILDEADLFLSSNFDLQKYPELNDLVVNHRHYGKAVIFITRRPQDIPTKIVESSKYSFWFKVGDGENVRRKLKEIDSNMVTLMDKLRLGDFRFIIKEIGVAPYIHERV